MIYKCSSPAWCQWMVHTFWAAPAMFCLPMTWVKVLDWLPCLQRIHGWHSWPWWILQVTWSCPEVPCTLAHISPTSVYIYYFQVCKLCSIEPRSKLYIAVVTVEHPRILHILRTTLELKLSQGRDYIVAENWYSGGICKGPSLWSVVNCRVQTALQRHQERLPAPFLVSFSSIWKYLSV